MTLRVSNPAGDGQLRPGGRWHRLLAALETGSKDVEQLLAATDLGRYPRWRERRKIESALSDMGRACLVSAGVSSPPVWFLTNISRRQLKELADRTPSTPSTGDGSTAQTKGDAHD